MGNILHTIKTDFHLPDINGERCVHAHIEQASCKACVAACPENAWVLDDESLGLNTTACDGCGLCVPACPEGAVTQVQACVIREEVSCEKGNKIAKKVLLLGCEITGLKQANCKCIHAVSESALLKLYRDGVHHIHVTRGDCQRCPRGTHENTQQLFERVKNINKMLRHRHLLPIHYNELAADDWLQLWKTPEKSAPGPQMSRRGFFRSALKQSVDMVLHQSNLDQTGDFTPLGKILAIDEAQESLFDEAVYPAVPAINSAKCNGCDACLRACPHQALRFIQDGENSHYQIDAAACTGCKICRDICDQDAIHVTRWGVQAEKAIALNQQTCQSCGARFHYPLNIHEKDNPRRSLCNICSQVDHQKNLFQVLD